MPACGSYQLYLSKRTPPNNFNHLIVLRFHSQIPNFANGFFVCKNKQDIFEHLWKINLKNFGYLFWNAFVFVVLMSLRWALDTSVTMPIYQQVLLIHSALLDHHIYDSVMVGILRLELNE